jgi:hypothetical protein
MFVSDISCFQLGGLTSLFFFPLGFPATPLLSTVITNLTVVAMNFVSCLKLSLSCQCAVCLMFNDDSYF